jgi:hypothetical protein
VFSLEQLIDSNYYLSLLPGGGAQKMIQEVGDFLFQQGVIKNRIDAGKLVDGSHIQTYLHTKKK